MDPVPDIMYFKIVEMPGMEPGQSSGHTAVLSLVINGVRIIMIRSKWQHILATDEGRYQGNSNSWFVLFTTRADVRSSISMLLPWNQFWFPFPVTHCSFSLTRQLCRTALKFYSADFALVANAPCQGCPIPSILLFDGAVTENTLYFIVRNAIV